MAYDNTNGLLWVTDGDSNYRVLRYGNSVPPPPTIGTAAVGNSQATVGFTAPASDGGSTITGYTATSSPGGITGTGTASPITVTGLTNNTSYTFTVTATNGIGTGSASAASNSDSYSPPPPPPLPDVKWHNDSDSDGYGDPASIKYAVYQPTGYILDSTDCDDTSAAVYPGAPEVAGDGIDQDCDGQDLVTWYEDSDQDGFGNALNTIDAATKPPGYVFDQSDCNDGDSSVHPGAAEIAGDNIDQDCDGEDTSVLLTGTLVINPDTGVVPVTIEFHTLVAQGTSPFIYEYTFGDGSQTLKGSAKVSHAYQQKGSFNAKVKVTDAAGISFVFTATVKVISTADLDSYQSQLIIDAEQIDQATQPDDMTGALVDAQNIIDISLTAVVNADPAIKKSVEDAIQAEVGELIVNTKDKLIDFIDNNQTNQVDIDNILSGVQDVMSSMVKNDLPVFGNTLADLETISGEIFSASVETLLANENLSSSQIDEIKNDNNKAIEFFKSNKHLLDDVVEASGIKIDVIKEFDTDDVENIGSNHGLTQLQTANLFNAVEPTLDVDKSIALFMFYNKTIAEIAVEIINTYYTSKTLVKFTIEPVAKNILIEFTDGTFISFLIESVSIVDDYVPKGVLKLPDGSLLGTNYSYAFKFVPYPVYPIDFTAEVIKLGVNPVLTQEGALIVDQLDNTKLSAKIGWEIFQNNSFESLTTSFSVTGGSDPSAEAYSLLVNYDSGLSQLLPPAVLAMDALLDMLKSLAPADYFIDTNTGIVTIGSLKLKPDYEFTALTSIDYTSIISNGGFVHNNLAFDIKDFNGDGLNDFGFYSVNPMGLQILYTVSN